MNGNRIVILGGGFGGAYCAAELEKRAHHRSLDVTLINRQNYFVFYPLLVEAGTGQLEPRHTVVSLRAFLKKTRFRLGEVDGVDFAQRVVRYHVPGDGEPRTVEYDHLVIALGSVTMMPPVPGLREYGFQMKSLADGVAMRDRMIRMLELADATVDARKKKSLLHFVVVGANFTGTEVAGEFHEFLHSARRDYPNVSGDDIRVTLVEMADRILGPLDPELASFATKKMRARGIDVITGIGATELTTDSVTLGDGRTFDTRTVIWCAGIAPHPLVKKLDVPTDGRGYIDCERDLRVKGCANVWALGDIAVNRDAEGQPYPATAQHALQQGEHLADNLLRVIDGLPPTPCNVVNKGTIAAIGCRTAVAKAGPFKLSGFAAWWLYRTVYLMKMPGLRRKVRLALDWTIDVLLGRDFVQLGLHQPDRASRSDRDDSA